MKSLILPLHQRAKLGWPMSVPARLATTAKTLTSRVRTILGCQCLSISRQHTSSSAEQPHPCVGSESGQPVAREVLAQSSPSPCMWFLVVGAGGCASAQEVTSTWSAPVFDPRLLGRSTTTLHSLPSQRCGLLHAVNRKTRPGRATRPGP